MNFCDSFDGYFRAARHNLGDKARCYVAGLLMKAPRKNMERMEEYVEDYDYQNQQQFLSDSPWDYRPLVERIGREVDEVLGGAESGLIIDESGFAKKGVKSVGVSRQWNGRLGKTDNCQVGVFAALSDGRRASLVDMRLYLPKCWVADPKRCAAAKIPEQERINRTKPELAREMIDRALATGLRFGWIGLDALYGNTPWLLRHIDDLDRVFVADVHHNQTVYPEDPKPYLPRRKGALGRKFTVRRARSAGVKVSDLFTEIPREQWQDVDVREATKGTLRVSACRRRVWLWDGVEKQARPWWAVCVIDESTGDWKCFISNAGVGASLESLVRKHAVRYWIERSFQDAKTSVGMADYQARGWVAWHHHMALVMLAMLFLLRERKLHEQQIELLSCQDIVELLDVYLPRTDRTKLQVIENIRQRHRKRRASIKSARKRRDHSRAFAT